MQTIFFTCRLLWQYCADCRWMNGWIWFVDRMILTGEQRRTRRGACHIATNSTTSHVDRSRIKPATLRFLVWYSFRSYIKILMRNFGSCRHCTGVFDNNVCWSHVRLQRVSLLSCPWERQLYRIDCEGHPVKFALLRDSINGTVCVLNTERTKVVVQYIAHRLPFVPLF
jgi:hypothetical protein